MEKGILYTDLGIIYTVTMEIIFYRPKTPHMNTWIPWIQDIGHMDSMAIRYKIEHIFRHACISW